MRKIFLGTLLSCVVLFTACDLDKYPEDQLSSDQSWETIKDAEKFRDGIYSLFKSVNGGKFTYISDEQADILNATLSFGNRGGDLYRWDFTSSQYDIEDFYQYNYKCIVNCNNIIQNIDNITISDADDQAEVNKIKGEAYLMRAMCYHAITLRFAKDYEPSTASSDLGLPIVLEWGPDAKPSRATLEATYQQIKSDIKDARANLTTAGEANAIYLTTDVIDALEARVDLYMHNYSEAISLADKIIAKYPLITTEEGLTNMWLNDVGSEVIFKVFLSVDERGSDNQYTPYLSFNTGTGYFTPDFIPTQWVVNSYENNDIRKGASFLNNKIKTIDEVAEVYLLNKYPGNPAIQNAPYQYYNMPKIFRSAEAYLIAAEAAYNEGNATKALDYLNKLRAARSASQLSLSGTQLMDAIQSEWVREFVGEGFRMNNLCRWHLGFSRHDTQASNVLTVGDNYTQLSVESTNKRFVWEIPANDLKANTNLIPNWGN